MTPWLSEPQRHRALGAQLWRYFLVAVMASVYVMILAPIAVVVVASFSSSERLFSGAELTLRWYSGFFEDANMREGFVLSFGVATVAATVSVVLGTLAALGLTRERFVLRDVTTSLLLSPIVFPTLITGVALLLYFRSLRVPTLLGLILGHTIISMPYVVRTVTASLAMFDTSLEEAARIHGAHPVRAFWRVTLPSIQPGLMAGAIFAFIVSFSEVNVSLFLSGPGSTPLPIHIFSQLQFGADQLIIAAASTLQICVTLILMLVIERLFGLSVAPQS